MPTTSEILPAQFKTRLKKTTQPEWVSPMLATLTEERFSRENWIYEPKFDGERCLTFKDGNKLTLLSRNKLSLNGNYPELVEACQRQKSVSYIIDGEVAAFKGKVTSFETLQGRMQERHATEAQVRAVPVFYYIFDIMYFDGYDLRGLPLRARKEYLSYAIVFKDPLRFAPHIEREGLNYYRQACRQGWEGVIAKNFESKYVSVRSKDWLKFKCVSAQELVIGGYTDPRGSRGGFGALLVGYYKSGQLIFAGKVGTGFSQETLRKLGGELSALERQNSPFKDAEKLRGVHWVMPELVAQVGFSEWTRYGMLRHPRFLGLRNDKAPKDVVREA